MKTRNKAALAVVLILAVGCASVGKGDPNVVRAEDLLTNSLTLYSAAFTYHDGDPTKGIPGHSTTETPAVYKTFERVRVAFPVAWNALDMAKRNYQADKSKGTSQLIAALDSLSALVAAIAPLIPGYTGAK